LETRKANLVSGKAPLRTRKFKSHWVEERLVALLSGLQWFHLKKIHFEETNFGFRESKCRAQLKEVVRQPGKITVLPGTFNLRQRRSDFQQSNHGFEIGNSP
jgi:hypothetical protein